MSHLVMIMAMMIFMRRLMEVGNDESEDDVDVDNAEMCEPCLPLPFGSPARNLISTSTASARIGAGMVLQRG